MVTLKRRSAWLGLGLGIGVGVVMEGSRAAAYEHLRGLSRAVNRIFSGLNRLHAPFLQTTLIKALVLCQLAQRGSIK